MEMTNTEYDKLTKKMSPDTKLYKTLPKAFFIGGLICCLGQALFNLYTFWGLNEQNARSVTSITLVFFSALLTGLKLYDKIAKHGGAGTLVPITGFANSVVAPALEFKTDESDIIYPSQKNLHNFRGEYDLVQKIKSEGDAEITAN